MYIVLNERDKYHMSQNHLQKPQKKFGETLTQLSLTLHSNRRIFYYQHYIHFKSLFSMLNELPGFNIIVNNF